MNTLRFAPDPSVRQRLRNDLGVTGAFVLVVVASLIADKGVDVVLRSLAELPEDVILWVVGASDGHDSLDRLVAKLDLRDRVRFLGLQRDVSPFMQAADVLVCPSLWGEAAGLVNIEGMACGIPVIASRVGGIPEIVADGQTGYLFPPGDHHALVDRVRYLRDNPQTCKAIGNCARATAVERFSAEKLLPDYLRWYQVEEGP